MKKNDGYVLLYVVFVIIILCFVAVWLSGSALGGIKEQREAVEQLQSRYEAESVLEKFAAKASVSRDDSFERYGFESEQSAHDGAKTEFESLLAAAAGEMGVTLYSVSWNGGDCRADVSAEAELCRLDASLEFSLQIYVGSREEDGEESFDYSIAAVTSRYLHYERDTEGGDP